MTVNWNKSNEKISKYFTVAEVIQNDPRRKPVTGSDIEKNILFMAAQLDIIRTKWGSAIGVTSWYRPPVVNREVGGVVNSQHITGGATDIYNYFGHEQEFEDFLDDHWFDRHLGYGVRAGRGFTHLDLRKGKGRWNY